MTLQQGIDIVHKTRALAKHAMLRHGPSRAEPDATSWLNETLRLESIYRRFF